MEDAIIMQHAQTQLEVLIVNVKMGLQEMDSIVLVQVFFFFWLSNYNFVLIKIKNSCWMFSK